MIKQLIKCKMQLTVREDPAGDGHFGAPRSRMAGLTPIHYTHTGIDYVCHPEEPVLSPVDGTVTKHGYTYADDLQWRYVEITDKNKLRHRLFYVLPGFVFVSEEVQEGDRIGTAQNISERHPRTEMLPHVHYEVKDQQDCYRNPNDTDEVHVGGFS